MSLVAVIYISSALICGTLIGGLVTLIFISLSLADLSRSVARITIEVLLTARSFDATNTNRFVEAPSEPDGESFQSGLTSEPTQASSTPMPPRNPTAGEI